MAAARLLVGTRKGAWVYTADAERRNWSLSAPMMPGWTIYHMAVDTRSSTPRLFAAGSHWAWGPLIARSDDGGATWDQRSRGLGFPQPMNVENVMGEKLGSVWQVVPGHPDEPGVIYAGTQPAGLFKSTDGGEAWAPVAGLNYPHTGRSGGPAVVANRRCTRSRSTRATHDACTSRSAPAALT